MEINSDLSRSFWGPFDTDLSWITILVFFLKINSDLSRSFWGPFDTDLSRVKILVFFVGNKFWFISVLLRSVRYWFIQNYNSCFFLLEINSDLSRSFWGPFDTDLSRITILDFFVGNKFWLISVLLKSVRYWFIQNYNSCFFLLEINSDLSRSFWGPLDTNLSRITILVFFVGNKFWFISVLLRSVRYWFILNYNSCFFLEINSDLSRSFWGPFDTDLSRVKILVFFCWK